MLDAIQDKLTSAGIWLAVGASIGTFVLGVITGLTNDTLRGFLARRRERRELEVLLNKDKRRLLLLATRHDGTVRINQKQILENEDPVSVGRTTVVPGMDVNTVYRLGDSGHLERRTPNKYCLTEKGRETGERLIVLYGDKAKGEEKDAE